MEKQSYTSTHPLGRTGPVTGSLFLYISFLVLFFFLPLCVFSFIPALLGRIGDNIKRNKDAVYFISTINRQMQLYNFHLNTLTL